MNKLFLIGNGFDLAHGLKTKYADFLLGYQYSALQKLITDHLYEDSLMSSRVGYNVGKFPESFSSLTKFNEFLELYGITFAQKYKFFDQLLKTAIDQNWVDIENQYYFELLRFFKILEQGNIEKHPRVESQVKELNFCLDAIKERLSEYLLTVDNSLKEIQPDIANHFNQELIKKQVSDSFEVMLLNFNYTSTLDLYLECFQYTNFSINHIHGKLNDANNPIIFGYGDEMDSYYQKMERLNSNEFLRNFKSFGYFKTKNYQNLLRFIDSNHFQVFIMGHSCGLSDRVLLNSIFEHKYCSRIKVYYHQKNGTENDFFEKTQELSRHFKPENKGIMRKIIAPFSESSPLVDNKV